MNNDNAIWESNLLWAGMLGIILGYDNAVDAFYKTYAIDSLGSWRGLYAPDNPHVKLVSEFSTIAIQLIDLGLFERYELMWRDAFTAAIAHVDACCAWHAEPQGVL